MLLNAAQCIALWSSYNSGASSTVIDGATLPMKKHCFDPLLIKCRTCFDPLSIKCKIYTMNSLEVRLIPKDLDYIPFVMSVLSERNSY